MPALRPASEAGPMRNPREGTSVVLRDTNRLTWHNDPASLGLEPRLADHRSQASRNMTLPTAPPRQAGSLGLWREKFWHDVSRDHAQVGNKCKLWTPWRIQGLMGSVVITLLRCRSTARVPLCIDAVHLFIFLSVCLKPISQKLSNLELWSLLTTNTMS